MTACTVAGLKASADFRLISKQGEKWHGPSFVMQILRRHEGAPFRFGLTASRRVGNAVVRNRAKRRLREVVRLCGTPLPPGFDLVLIARTAAATQNFSAMCAEFKKGLAALKVQA